MMLASWWKQLKRRWRRKKLTFWMTIAIGLIVASAPMNDVEKVSAANKRYSVETNEYEMDRNKLSAMMTGKKISLEQLERMTDPVLVYFQQIYVCGEDQQLLGQLDPQEVIEVLQEHPDWSIFTDDEQHIVVIRRYIDDLSNYCKSNAYFGLDRNGNFSLFDGLPEQDKIMRTFFQIDVQYMESNLPRERIFELTKGIPVSDIDEFNSVLETFSDFAMERNKQEDY